MSFSGAFNSRMLEFGSAYAPLGVNGYKMRLDQISGPIPPITSIPHGQLVKTLVSCDANNLEAWFKRPSYINEAL